MNKNEWYIVDNVNEVSSPSLLIFPDRIESNIRKMIEMTGSIDLLRPHVKTHKIPEIIKLQMKYGIYKFKCATISETEMVARCGATDIILAMQPVGPNLGRYFHLKQDFKEAKISCIADSEEVILQLSAMAVKTGLKTHVWIDINNGMDRTGISPGKEALELYKMIVNSPMLIAEGLHVYDGHITQTDFSLRQKICNESFTPVRKFIDELKKTGINPINIVAGGTPTFSIHKLRKGVECSPGTTILWDNKSESSYKEMDFHYAAVLLTRVVSKPSKDLLCIDLGHKAVASEMPQPRVKILGMENYTIVSHSEEHMVIQTEEALNYKPGDPLYCIPTHICPTVDRYDFVTIITNHKAAEQWKVEARRRMINI
jgi:D-serine deaminase-like pyridoxal phosphate-dependent protein